MEPSNLSINSSQQSASQFFQKSAASLKSWGSRVCQQLHHHREILHTYSPKTKIGLLIAVNALFFVGIRAIVNSWEARANDTNPEKTLLNDKIATVIVGILTAGINVGLSKLYRYQLPALTLCAITLSSVAVYLILKKPQPLLATIQNEITSELQLISQHRGELGQTRTQLQEQRDEIAARLNNSSTSSSTPPFIPISTSSALLPQETAGDDQQELERLQGELNQVDQADQSLSQLAETLGQEAVVVQDVLRTNTVPLTPGTPERVNLLRQSLQNRFHQTLTQSPLNASRSLQRLPQSTPPSSPVNSIPPSSPATQRQTSSSSSTDDATSTTLLSSPSTRAASDPSTPIRTNSAENPEGEPTEHYSPTPIDPHQVLATRQSTTRWLVSGAIQYFGPALVNNAPSIASTLWGLATRR